VVYTDDPLSFEIGQEYLVYSFDHEGRLETFLCLRTKLLKDSQRALPVLGEGEMPQASVDSPSRSFLSRALPFLAIGGAILLFLGLLFPFHRRRFAGFGSLH
jgi:hypothetical protein